LRPRIWIPLLLLIGLGAVGWYVAQLRNQPPEISFTKAIRETITSSVSTNGKVEPIEWATVRAERAGPVEKILVSRGDRVTRDQPLVSLDNSEARAALVAAETRIAQAKADLDVLSQGGRPADQAEIAGAMDRAKLDLENAQREHERALRLEQKQAGTKAETITAKEAVDRAQVQIKALEAKRAALVAMPDKTAAQARLRDAEEASRVAQTRIEQGTIRAPIDGILYQFELKPGAYLNVADIVGTIGRLERVHVNVFVDEPDLGRVRKGMPVVISWDAMPGRQWKGVVEKMPVQIVTQGARQVGEVVCTIENHELVLIPGTNVTADILTETAENVVTIAKEGLRRENAKDGVYLLENVGEMGARIKWQPVSIGVNNTTRAAVGELKEGDAVALPTDRQLEDGMLVRPVFP
jgi:HlyD family secretion protein